MTIIERATPWRPAIDLAGEADFVVGELNACPSRREVEVGGDRQVLQPRVMQVLVALAHPTSETVSHAELISRCWSGLSVGEDAIVRCIAQLRRLAERYPKPPFEIATIAGVGYRMTPQAVGASVRNEAAASIAVLPFANMSGDPEQDYFSDGISDDIITDLSKVAALRVISRNSTFAFKGRHVDLPLVARQLDVTHVLEGSVRKAGNRVRITAQLIDGATNGHLWAERYDRDLSDIFALQDEISQAIVAALRLKLLPEEKKSIELRGTDNPDAFDRYLRARALTDRMGAANLERAIGLYREAIAIDPAYRLAVSGLLQALSNYANAAPERRSETLKEIDAIYERDIATNPNPGAVLRVRALQLQARRDYLGAERLLDEAARTTPPAILRRLRAWLLEAVCRFEEAIEAYRPTVREDPLSLVTSFMFQSRLDAAGRTGEAWTEYERSRDLAGDRGMVELLAFLRSCGRAGPLDGAEQYRRFLSCRGPEMRAPVFEELEPVLGDQAAARAILTRAHAGHDGRNVMRLVQLSLLAAAFGADNVALSGLRSAFVDQRCTPQRYLWLPVLGKARQDPRFKAIVRDLGLYDYWRTSGAWGDFARPLGEADFEIVR